MHDIVFVKRTVSQVVINRVEQLAAINAATVAIDKIAVGIEGKCTATQITNSRGTIADDEETKLITGSHALKSD